MPGGSRLETFQRGVVMLDEQRLLHFRDHQDFSLGVPGEYRALVLGKMAVTAKLLYSE